MAVLTLALAGGVTASAIAAPVDVLTEVTALQSVLLTAEGVDSFEGGNRPVPMNEFDIIEPDLPDPPTCCFNNWD
jgi:hypothetical protein